MTGIIQLRVNYTQR